MNLTDRSITGNENTELQHNELNLHCEAQSHVKQSALISLQYILGVRVSHWAVNWGGSKKSCRPVNREGIVEVIDILGHRLLIFFVAFRGCNKTIFLDQKSVFNTSSTVWLVFRAHNSPENHNSYFYFSVCVWLRSMSFRGAGKQ